MQDKYDKGYQGRLKAANQNFQERMKKAQEKNSLQRQKYALKVKNDEFNKEF